MEVQVQRVQVIILAFSLCEYAANFFSSQLLFKFIFLFKTTNCFFILYLRFSSPIQILFLNTTVISLLCTFLQVWSTTCSSTTSWNMWVFSGDMPLEVFKNYLWEHFYWKKKMHIFSYFSCLTSGPYNKAAATVKEEET